MKTRTISMTVAGQPFAYEARMHDGRTCYDVTLRLEFDAFGDISAVFDAWASTDTATIVDCTPEGEKPRPVRGNLLDGKAATTQAAYAAQGTTALAAAAYGTRVGGPAKDLMTLRLRSVTGRVR